MSNAVITDNVEARVRICPITATDCLKVDAISISSNPVAIFGGAVANLAIVKAGKMNLLCVFLFVNDPKHLGCLMACLNTLRV
jgi:hypothetical protein